jgi:streptogramin lyase
MKTRGNAFLLAAAGLWFAGTPAIADNLFVANYTANTVQIFNSSGQNTGVWSNPYLDGPMGVSFDNSGNLYVGNFQNNTIVKFNSAGQGSLFATLDLNEPRGLACDANGNVYVANYNAGDIVRYNSLGQPTVFATGLAQPTGLAFDSHGNLFVAGQGGYVDKFNTVTGIGTLFASTGTTGPACEGLTFDPAGNLYVANYWNDAIYKFNANGVGGVFASTGGGYSNPFGLAYDNGTLYASCNVNEILTFNSSGNGSFFASTSGGPWYMAVQPTPEPPTLAILLAGLACSVGTASRICRNPKSPRNPTAVS